MMMKAMTIGAVLLSTGLAATAARAWDQYPFDEYLQRSDRVTLGAGDSKAANEATHIIDPWPAYAGNRHIPGDGQRMSGAIERYKDVSKLPRAPKPIEPLYDVQSSGSGSGSGSGGH